MEPIPFELATTVRYTNPVPADSRSGPWPTPAAACQQVARAVRVPGLVVDIQAGGGPVVKWWWPGPGLNDADLVPYLTASSIPGSGSAGRGTYLELGVYTTQNQVFPLPAGTQDINLHWETGRVLQPLQDYTLDTEADPPTAMVTAALADFQGEGLWARTYRAASRTLFTLPTPYGPGYPAVVLAAGTADVEIYWSTGRILQPGVDYSYEAPTRNLTFLADSALYAGEEIWGWLYS